MVKYALITIRITCCVTHPWYKRETTKLTRTNNIHSGVCHAVFWQGHAYIYGTIRCTKLTRTNNIHSRVCQAVVLVETRIHVLYYTV